MAAAQAARNNLRPAVLRVSRTLTPEIVLRLVRRKKAAWRARAVRFFAAVSARLGPAPHTLPSAPPTRKPAYRSSTAAAPAAGGTRPSRSAQRGRSRYCAKFALRRPPTPTHRAIISLDAQRAFHPLSESDSRSAGRARSSSSSRYTPTLPRRRPRRRTFSAPLPPRAARFARIPRDLARRRRARRRRVEFSQYARHDCRVRTDATAEAACPQPASQPATRMWLTLPPSTAAVAIVREPVARAYSHYTYFRTRLLGRGKALGGVGATSDVEFRGVRLRRG